MNKEEQKFTRLKNVIRLSKRLKKYRLRMVAAIAAGVGNQLSMVAASVLGAWTVGLAIDGKLMQKLNYVIAATIAVIIIRIVFYVLEMWICHDVAFKVLADFRIQLFDSIERVSPAILLNMRSGQLASTLMGDVEIMEWFFAHTFGSVLVAIITPVILMIILWQILPILGSGNASFCSNSGHHTDMDEKESRCTGKRSQGSSGRCQCGNVRRSAGVKRNTDSEL